MLRKIFSLGALVVVAVSFGVANASAAPKSPSSPAGGNNHGHWTDGFSDGRD
jgi:Spy/CpxP family protein refolding chaperone